MLTIVRTKCGEARGVISEGGFALFKGIPYAAPPAGRLRWAEPQPPEPWTGVRNCDQWGAACPQTTPHTPDSFYGKEFYSGGDYPPSLSEDCLFLNIWTPAKSEKDKLPVMMWIHGGGVLNGYSHEIEFDGDAICRRGVILVTINYRLNIFGFFAHPELTAESPNHASGNYGILDQVQALKWIHDNIAAYGGDPGNVTVFGQSGGGRSTNVLCCSPLTAGLMHHAIIESAGGTATAGGRAPREQVEQRGTKFMRDIGANSLADLRALSWQDLLAKFNDWTAQAIKANGFGAMMSAGFNISTDGYALPLSMEDSLLQGRQHNIDYILGHTSNEGVGAGKGRPVMINMAASLRGWSRLQLEQGKKPVYMYCFDRMMPGDDSGAFHSSELWYIFGTLKRCWRPFIDQDHTLSEIMIDYWTNFAKNGNPNGSGLPFWKPFLDDRLEMRLAPEGCEMADYSLGGEMEKLENGLMGR